MAVAFKPEKRLFYESVQKHLLTESQLGLLSFPLPDPSEEGKAVLKTIPDSTKCPSFKISPSSTKRYCSRCLVLYDVDEEGKPLEKETCIYHSGRKFIKVIDEVTKQCYSCCPEPDVNSIGCCQWYCHVSTNFEPDNLRGFVEVREKDLKTEEEYDVLALDCEMCYTNDGLVVCKVALVDWEGKIIYDEIVLPDKPVVDYNTRFSGVTEKDMLYVGLRLKDVQQELLSLFSKRTILVGHSLENDMLSLKLIHTNIVDTSVVFPHKKGLPFKQSLMRLASHFLKKEIHSCPSGHNSAEDAIVCIELMKLKQKHQKYKQHYRNHRRY